MLIYNDCEFIRDIYKNLHIESCSRGNNLTLRHDNATEFPEVLMSNYGTQNNERVGKQMGLFDLDFVESEDEENE